MLLLLTDKQEGKHVGSEGDHDDHRSGAHFLPSLLRRIVGIRRQDEPRELVMLEGSDGDLCVFVDERESLSLVEESELVDSIDVGYLDDLPVTLPPPLRWSSPRPAGRRRRSNSCARRVQHHELHLHVVRLPLPRAETPTRNLRHCSAVPLLHQHRVVERVLHAVDHVVPRDLRAPRSYR